MISFQRREDVLPSVLMLLSLLVLAGTLAYMLLVPKPNAAANTRAGTSSRRRMADDIADMKKQTSRAQAAVRTRLWQGDPEAVTAKILAQIEAQTGKQSLKLMAFRPDRSQEFAGVTELRFDAQVTGPYTAVHSLMETLDAPGSKVALRSVQITQSQAAGGTVSASLGLSAFAATDPSLVPVPLEGGRHG